MSKPKNTNPGTERVEVVISPNDFPHIVAALESLKRTIVEEATSHAQRSNLPMAAVPSLSMALMLLSQNWVQGNIDQLEKIFPELGSTQFEEIGEPVPVAPQPKTKFRGH